MYVYIYIYLHMMKWNSAYKRVVGVCNEPKIDGPNMNISKKILIGFFLNIVLWNLYIKGHLYAECQWKLFSNNFDTFVSTYVMKWNSAYKRVVGVCTEPKIDGPNMNISKKILIGFFLNIVLWNLYIKGHLYAECQWKLFSNNFDTFVSTYVI
jgi:hypothetical protein